MELRNVASYASAVRPELPDAAFEPARSRILWLPAHVAIIAALAYAISSHEIPAALWPVTSLVIGVSMCAIAFLGHEVLHGAVVRGRLPVRIVGFICMLPFTLSPTLWTNWHNRVHHNNCAQVGRDPDMYPTLAEYGQHLAARIMADYFGLGGPRWRGFATLLFGFTGQSQQMLWQGRSLGLLTPSQHGKAILEFLVGVAFWTMIALVVGALPFVFIYALPLVVANIIAMSFISTNHGLSSLTPGTNDPLVNSLSVTLPRALEWLSLDFGFHVEHHVFPTMSARSGRIVRAALRRQFADRYQSMSLPRALVQLHCTGRVFRDDTTLIDPRTGTISPTLQPRA